MLPAAVHRLIVVPGRIVPPVPPFLAAPLVLFAHPAVLQVVFPIPFPLLSVPAVAPQGLPSLL